MLQTALQVAQSLVLPGTVQLRLTKVLISAGVTVTAKSSTSKEPAGIERVQAHHMPPKTAGDPGSLHIQYIS